MGKLPFTLLACFLVSCSANNTRNALLTNGLTVKIECLADSIYNLPKGSLIRIKYNTLLVDWWIDESGLFTNDTSITIMGVLINYRSARLQ